MSVELLKSIEENIIYYVPQWKLFTQEIHKQKDKVKQVAFTAFALLALIPTAVFTFTQWAHQQLITLLTLQTQHNA